MAEHDSHIIPLFTIRQKVAERNAQMPERNVEDGGTQCPKWRNAMLTVFFVRITISIVYYKKQKWRKQCSQNIH